jgi:hypothetical protein
MGRSIGYEIYAGNKGRPQRYVPRKRERAFAFAQFTNLYQNPHSGTPYYVQAKSPHCEVTGAMFFVDTGPRETRVQGFAGGTVLDHTSPHPATLLATPADD